MSVFTTGIDTCEPLEYIECLELLRQSTAEKHLQLNDLKSPSPWLERARLATIESRTFLSALFANSFLPSLEFCIFYPASPIVVIALVI